MHHGGSLFRLSHSSLIASAGTVSLSLARYRTCPFAFIAYLPTIWV
jgi:hypothetical protein